MAKSFKDTMQKKATNPTLQFITPPEDKQPHEQEEKPIAATQPAQRAFPQYGEETKSRRLQLLLTPSLYDAIKAEAGIKHISVNELINTIMKDAIRK